jgi:SagB-type dehydrogenase family enzyme
MIKSLLRCYGLQLLMKMPSTFFRLLVMTLLVFGAPAYPGDKETEAEKAMIKLPEPRHKSYVSLEETLVKRRSIRDYTHEPLALEEVSQLMWAAQGITSDWGGRTSPSAGALYPLEVYVIVGNVKGLAAGVYRYMQKRHELVMVSEGDIRSALADAALGQGPVKHGAVDIVLTSVYDRTTRKYGDRGIRYVLIEIGHVAQNISLQATAMELGSVMIGAFHDEEVKGLLKLTKEETPLYIIPIGRQ